MPSQAHRTPALSAPHRCITAAPINPHKLVAHPSTPPSTATPPPLHHRPAPQALALNCKESLEYLDVSFCRGFSQRALGLVADRCHKLKYVRLLGCSQVCCTRW